MHKTVNSITRVRRALSPLWALWWSVQFWSTQKLNTFFLLVIIAFWVRQGDAVLNGRSPLIGWMISAEIAIIVATWLTLEAFAELTGKEKEEMGASLLQYFTIIVGNTTIVIMQFVNGITLKPWDYIIFQIDLCGLWILTILMALFGFGPRSPWARCGYLISLKASPQVVQAIWVLKGKGALDILGAILLVTQAIGRFRGPIVVYLRSRRLANVKIKALTLGTGTDLASTLLLAGAVVGGGK
ncbi:MAG TPA: hypothetical protein VFZ48_05355 [Candidatus Saccharimonadales bacterium]